MEIDAAGSRPGFRQKKVESVSKARRKHALTCRKPGCKPGRKPGLQPGLQLARIIECGLFRPTVQRIKTVVLECVAANGYAALKII